MRYYLGIDPGMTGAMALLRHDGWINVADLSSDPVIVCDRLRELLATVGTSRIDAVIELAHTYPKQGIISAFTYGQGYGGIIHILAWNNIPTRTVPARVWKKAMGLDSDKKKSLKMARSLFPQAELHLAKHDGRAEALLLGVWLQRGGQSAKEKR